VVLTCDDEIVGFIDVLPVGESVFNQIAEGTFFTKKGHLIVMALAPNDVNRVFIDTIDKPVFVGDAPAPVASKFMSQWFRFA